LTATLRGYLMIRLRNSATSHFGRDAMIYTHFRTIRVALFQKKNFPHMNITNTGSIRIIQISSEFTSLVFYYLMYIKGSGPNHNILAFFPTDFLFRFFMIRDFNFCSFLNWLIRFLNLFWETRQDFLTYPEVFFHNTG